MLKNICRFFGLLLLIFLIYFFSESFYILFIMNLQIQSLLDLLSECSCCPSRRHVVTVTHGNGKAQNFYVGSSNIPAYLEQKWNAFPRATKPLSAMTFPDMRTEATRILKHFTTDPIPILSKQSDCICYIPDVWLVPLQVESLPKSKEAIFKAHGKVETITLQTILNWGMCDI